MFSDAVFKHDNTKIFVTFLFSMCYELNAVL